MAHVRATPKVSATALRHTRRDEGRTLAAAFVLAAASPAAAAPAQVPCTQHRRRSRPNVTGTAPATASPGGSLVVVGTQDGRLSPAGQEELDHLPAGRGRHAQPRGQPQQLVRATPRPRTTSSAGPARSTRAGGDNYGSFGGGAPNCDGKPRLAAVVERRLGFPAPAHAGRDADARARHRAAGRRPRRRRRGTRATATTRTPKIYPGAPEVPGDGLDQDCSGADAAGKLSAVVAFNWTKHGSSIKRRQPARHRSARRSERPRSPAQASARAARRSAPTRPAPRAASR